MEYKITLPMDNDGFTELQCPYCKMNFSNLISGEVLRSEALEGPGNYQWQALDCR